MRFGKGLVFAVLMPLLLGFDFASKKAVEASLPIGAEVAVVPGWLSLFHLENPNIAFSIPVPIPLVVVFGVLALGAMAASLRALPAGARVQSAGIAALVAGALGNLIDRIGDGTVTDFVRIQAGDPALAAWFVDRVGTASWPVFNIADVCIGVGVALWFAGTAFDDGATGEVDAEPQPA